MVVYYIKLTTKTRYAARAMVDLARQPMGTCATVAEIAKRQAVTYKYMGKIFRMLLQSNLIKSKKGPGGGYYLSRKPKTIKLTEIMTAVGESLVPVYCVKNRKTKACARVEFCPTRPCWIELHQLLTGFFSGVTLDDLATMRTYTTTDKSKR